MQKKNFLPLIVGTLALGPTAFAGSLALGNDSYTGVQILADAPEIASDYRISLEARVGRLDAHRRWSPAGQEFTEIEIPGYQQTGIVGAPSLPVMNRILEVPHGGAVSVQVTSRSVRKVDLVAEGYEAPVFPRQAPQVKTGAPNAFAWDQRTYLVGGFQQDAMAQVEEIGMLRDKRLVLLKLAPVGYDPVSGVLEVHDELQVEVTVEGADLAATADHKARYASPYFANMASNLLVPPAVAALEPEVAGPRTYAVVADEAFRGPLEPFLDWKRRQGFDVILTTTAEVSADASAIQTHVHGLYNQPADGHKAPDFLLLVGDHDNVPAKQTGSGWSGHITDLYFSAVTDDYLPDILSGRLSARTTAELVPQLEKLLEYERFEMADPSYLQRVALTAGWDSSHAVEWGYPQINYGTENYFNGDHGFTDVSVFLSAGAHQNQSEIVSTISSGVAFYNYTAHGSETSFADPTFTIADVEGLQNEGKYGLILANCCVTGSFNRSKCFGESWLRAPGRGAIGYIGGSNNTYWDEDLWFGNGFYSIAHPNAGGDAPAKADTGIGAYDHAFEAPHATAASLMVAGNLAVEASNTSRKLYYWEVYHLFGDPSLQVWMGVPSENPVQHPARLEDPAQGIVISGAPGSYVGLSYEGKTLCAGFIGEAGTAHFNLCRLPESGTADLVITAKNRKPYFATVALGPER